MHLIKTESVVKRQNAEFQLGPVNLLVRSGEILGVTGEHGAGKTTLLRLIWGFLPTDQGIVSVFHRQPHLHQISIRRRTGYLPESPCFEIQSTARHHLEFVSHFYEGWDKANVDALLDQFQIDPDARIQELSMSCRIKLALISAAGHNPFLLLLDNPMMQLETQDWNEISHFLRALTSKRGTGVVVSAQRSSDLLGLSDSIITLIDGKIDGKPRERQSNNRAKTGI